MDQVGVEEPSSLELQENTVTKTPFHKKKIFKAGLVIFIIFAAISLFYFLTYYTTCRNTNVEEKVKAVSTGIQLINPQDIKNQPNLGSQIADEIIQETMKNTKIEELTNSSRVDLELMEKGFRMRAFDSRGQPEEMELIQNPQKYKFKFGVGSWGVGQTIAKQPQEIGIFYREGKFVIRQKSVEVETSFSLTINNDLHALIVLSPNRRVSANMMVLPWDLIQILGDRQIVKTIEKTELVENENPTIKGITNPAQSDEVIYRVVGNHEVEIQNQEPYRFPVRSDILVTTGSIQNIKLQRGVSGAPTFIDMKILPEQAIDELTRDRIIEKVSAFEINDIPKDKKAFFKISGIREMKFFGFLPYQFRVTSQIDTGSGNRVSIQRPLFARIILFLLKGC